ncbi:hypothetical protein NG798_26850 [Ancylothrix sp. C2]|uniref:hypothetical protein n=1 Tax=Ancylothrix sp. D3o TaxID=2953691 RepID=UPI0021BAB06F|nr:hypothetical protein [Ancylothrix sp. D3o]MCT7953423.1 hypothetical protein [Ancylothrix sp. D3o]
MSKNLVRLSLVIPQEMRSALEELAEYPYASVSNAAVVLIKESLTRRENKPERDVNDVIELLANFTEKELTLVSLKASERLLMLLEQGKKESADVAPEA